MSIHKIVDSGHGAADDCPDINMTIHFRLLASTNGCNLKVIGNCLALNFDAFLSDQRHLLHQS